MRVLAGLLEDRVGSTHAREHSEGGGLVPPTSQARNPHFADFVLQ